MGPLALGGSSYLHVNVQVGWASASSSVLWGNYFGSPHLPALCENKGTSGRRLCTV